MSVPDVLDSRFVEVQHMRLHYLVAGHGRPVLMIHGLGSSGGLEWRRNLEALAAQHRVFALDLPGFGRSDKPRIDYTLELFVECVSQFLDAVEVRRTALVGASLGGRIAVGLALRHPDQVERLCLVDALGFGRPARNWVYRAMVVPGLGEVILRGVEAAMRRLRPGVIRRLWAWYVRRPRRYAALLSDAHLKDVRTVFHEPGFQEAYLGTLRALARGRALRDHVQVGAEASELLVPTLIVWGAEDRLFPVAHAEAAARRIRGARLVVFAGCGHTPQLEDAARFNTLLAAFLDSA